MDQMIEETPHSRYSKASWNSELNTWREVSSRSIDDDDDIGDTTIATSIVTKVNGNDDADGNDDDDDGGGGDTKGDSDEELDIHIDRIFDHGM